MSGDEPFLNISGSSGNLIEGIWESEKNKNIHSDSGEQKQDALYNDAPTYPQVVILNPKKPAHYKMFPGPEGGTGGYLYSERCVPVQVAITNPRRGFELIVTAKYKALTHQREAVQACQEHCNIPPAESKSMDLRTPNMAAFVLMAGGPRSVQYELEGLHPIARVPLNPDAEEDVVNLVFPCLSSCKPHKIRGRLMLLHLNIREIDTGTIVSPSVLTVRVAANVSARASQKYEEDMLGKTIPRRPAKRPKPGQGGEGLDNTAEVVDIVTKYLKRKYGNERKDDASNVVDVMDPELNQDSEERDHTYGVGDTAVNHPEVNQDDPDVANMAAYLLKNGGARFAKEAVDSLLSDNQATASFSTLINETGSASNQVTSLDASNPTNKSMVNIGASSVNSLDSMTRTDNLFIQMGNIQTSMVPMANNSALTLGNQNQTPPEGCSLTSSASLDDSNNRPIYLKESAVSADVGFLVTGLKNPENDCTKIQQYVESLGATCSQAPVVTPIFDYV